MSYVSYPNVDTYHGYVIRGLWLDHELNICPLSRKIRCVKDKIGLVSTQKVNTALTHFRVSYDPVKDEVMAMQIKGRVRHRLNPKELENVLDACGIGLLVWLCDDRLTPRDISYYVDSDILNVKRIIEKHMLDKVFPNMSDEFVQNIAKQMQSLIPVVALKISEHVDLAPWSSVDPDDLIQITSAGARRIANNPRVNPKVLTSVVGIPDVLPIAFFRSAYKSSDTVKSSIFLTLENGEEETVNLDKYVEQLDVPVGWFTSVLYTLPKNVKEAVHIVHRPFLTGKCTRNHGTVITVYTA